MSEGAEGAGEDLGEIASSRSVSADSFSALSDRLRSLNTELGKIAVPLIDLSVPGLGEQIKGMVADITEGVDLGGVQRLLVGSLDTIVPRNLRPLAIDQQVGVVTASIRCHFGASDTFSSEAAADIASVAGIDELVLASVADHGVDACQGSEDTLTRLAESGSRHADHAVLCLRAFDAFRGGHEEASQALATVVWDSHLTRTLASPIASTMKSEHGTGLPDMDDDLDCLYRKAAWAPAFAGYSKKRRGLYNRHETVHGASKAQFRRVNALCALTVATGVLAYTARADARRLR